MSALMGILNLTPDSFSEKGEFFGVDGRVDVDKAARRALQMFKSGAAVVDLGGESTRPGAAEVDVEEEISRVIPVVKAIKQIDSSLPLSVDTRKYPVAQAALAAGADIINDISGLQYSPEIAGLVAEYDAGLVIMHMRGTPETMQEPENLEYNDLIGQISEFLADAANKAISCGVKKENIYLDPGIGFSKTVEQNLELIRHVDCFKRIGCKLLYAPSKKSFIGRTLNLEDPQARIWGTAGVAAYLNAKDVELIRVHDVTEMAQVLKMYNLCCL